MQGLGGLDTLFSNLDKISTLTFRGAKTMSAKLEQNKDVAYLSYKLATIKTDVELDVTCDELTVSPPDDKQLHQLFSRYEFKRWLADVEAGKWLDSKKIGQQGKQAVNLLLPQIRPLLLKSPQCFHKRITRLF